MDRIHVHTKKSHLQVYIQLSHHQRDVRNGYANLTETGAMILAAIHRNSTPANATNTSI